MRGEHFASPMIVSDLPAGLEMRFWAKVRKGEDCWEWTGFRDSRGYGRIGIRHRPMLAHRISWLIAHGTLPSTLICHHCDNPPCVRPEHLFNGTHSDNAADRESKGRGHQVAKKGEAHYKARLTEDAVRSIRALHRQGERMIDIARKFECDPTNIRHIITGKNWKSVL